VRFAALLRVMGVPILCAAAAAQIQNGAITGTIVDSTGALVPNAHVILRQAETGLEQDARTNTAGQFTFTPLRPGTYSVVAAHIGFREITAPAVIVPAGGTTRVDFTLLPAAVADTVSVTAEASSLNLDNARLSDHVDGSRIAALPLNGRNLYDLLKQAAGATNVTGVSYESGAGVAVNGVRPSFNGFFVDGASQKRLSGGYTHPLIQDSVAEFQVLTLNNSTEFGSSAGAITNVVTRSGTNERHGTAWYAFRHDAMDATPFFLRQAGQQKPELRFHQYGASTGGPLRKGRAFYFAAYEGYRFRTSTSAAPALAETAEFRAAVRTAFPDSIAALLYRDFPPSTGGPVAFTLERYVQGPDGVFGGTSFSGSGMARFSDYLCPDRTSIAIAGRFAALFGVTAADQAEMTGRCSTVPALRTGLFGRDRPFLQSVASEFPTRSAGNLFHGQQGTARLDLNAGARHRFWLRTNIFITEDEFSGVVPGFSSDVITTAIRGFRTPAVYVAPVVGASWMYLFSPSTVHEVRGGYSGAYSDIQASNPGVPGILLLDGTLGFGASSGFPRDFRDHIWHIGSSHTLTRGSHTLRMGADLRRNRENSDFNIGRPSYLFFDALFFAVDAPFFQAGGVDPGLSSGTPARLASNTRHFSNHEIGAYFSDVWRITQRLTLSLGLRYDLFTRHTEQNDLSTTFRLGPGRAVIEDLATGAGQLQAASAFAGTSGCSTPAQIRAAQLAGICGPGGFAAAPQLGGSDRNNLAPVVGFAWDPGGNGQTAIRGGFGVSYEGTLYDMMSFSRYNLPYYSLNQVSNFLAGDVNRVAYGPQTPGLAPTYTGTPPPGQFSGTGAQAQGNIIAWDPSNPNLSGSTGIVLSEGLRDPYVMNWFAGLQQAVGRHWVVEANYVGTGGRKLFRSEDINRIPGGRLPPGVCVEDDAARRICSQANLTPGTHGRAINPVGRLNPNYGTLRVWRSASTSSYHGMQIEARRRGERFQLSAQYTWSHSIDSGSTWFSSFTTANGMAAGDAFTTDQTRPKLDRGNSIFDVRHRMAADFGWKVPGWSGNAFAELVTKGWTANGIVSLQTGAHWSPFDPRPRVLRALTPGACSSTTFDPRNCVNAGGDYNLDGQANDRPNAAAATVKAGFAQWAGGFQLPAGFFTAPCLGCASNLGRNTFVGPSYWAFDLSLGKRFAVNERLGVQVRADAFNLFNRTNFQLPGNAGRNRINDPQFGKAGGTFHPRQIQLQLRASF